MGFGKWLQLTQAYNAVTMRTVHKTNLVEVAVLKQKIQ